MFDTLNKISLTEQIHNYERSYNEKSRGILYRYDEAVDTSACLRTYLIERSGDRLPERICGKKRMFRAVEERIRIEYISPLPGE